MESFYLDESGSINSTSDSHKRWFVVSMVYFPDIEKAKRCFKRFVSSRMDKLKECPKADRMFADGKFRELKGAALTPELKLDFINYFCRNGLLEIYYIKFDNQKAGTRFKLNCARVFNYLLKLTFQTMQNRSLVPASSDIFLQIDERNVRTDSRAELAGYLTTELCIADSYYNSFDVHYYDSTNNKLVQVADVLANILYSSLVSESYCSELKQLQQNDIIKLIFEFPLSIK